MSETEQILLIDPLYELKFKGPFTQLVHSVLILKNPSDEKVAFVITTTTPELYFVFQNCGILAPQQKAKILVTLKPFGYDANERYTHKFLVETFVIDPVADYGDDGKTFQWVDIEESRIMSTKLKCSFEMPSDEHLFESNNTHEDTISVFRVNAEKELQKAASEVEELQRTADVSLAPETYHHPTHNSAVRTYSNTTSETEQRLLIIPLYELKFKGQLTKPLSSQLILKNPWDEKVAFMINTTAPERYSVDQNCGILGPQQKAKILVTLEPFGLDANEIGTHKFLVQTVFIDPVAEYGEDGKTFQWRDIEESRIMNTKLKCSFETPSVEHVIESNNTHEDTISEFRVDAEKELQKAVTEFEELREEIRNKEILLRVRYY